MRRRAAGAILGVALVTVLVGHSGAPAAAVPEGPEYPSPEWFAREAENYAKTQEEPRAQTESPLFQERWQTQSMLNIVEYRSDEYHNGPYYESSGNLCASYGQQCVGEPFLYEEVDSFYSEEAERVPVSYYDSGGALLLGYVWAPRASGPGDELPGVVIETGSVQAPETLYRWFAQSLVRNGYVVMTYDVRGQGRSDNETPEGEEGTNSNPDVFVENLVDSVDLFLAVPDDPYANNERYAEVKPGAELTSYNPFHQRLDPTRLGIVGHSLGATGVSVVQGLDPWIGQLDSNPVDVAVAWDDLDADSTSGSGLAAVSYEVSPRVPAMGQSGDYHLTPQPHTEPPDPEGKKAGYHAWRDAGLPTYEVVVQGGTHYEWSYLPTFPSTAWGQPWSGEEGWGNPMVEHYSLAWLDRWLKQPGEPGYADADARLLQDERWCERLSFYSRSARSFPDRQGRVRHVEDIRAACLEAAAEPTPSGSPQGATEEPGGEAGGQEETRGALPATGGGASAAGLIVAGGAALGALAHRRRASRTIVPARRRRRRNTR